MKYKLLLIPKLLVALALAAWLVMLLWNWIMPHLFAGSALLDYWRALGLLVLCRILFGGLGGRHRDAGARHWQRWQAMTQEEREQFRATRMGRFWGPAKD